MKSFEKFLIEKKGDIIDVILDRVDGKLESMVDYIESKSDVPYTESVRYLEKLRLSIDLIKALQKYTQASDTLKELSADFGNTGLEVFSSIERDGVEYYFNTYAIFAGGHNVQRLHYRYKVSTNLPPTNRKEVAKEYSAVLKKETKKLELSDQIAKLEIDIESLEAEAKLNAKKSDADIIAILKTDTEQSMAFRTKDWNEYVKSGAGGYNSKEEYEREMEKWRQDSISTWKRKNIDWKQNQANTNRSRIKVLRKKLSSL